MGWGNVECVLGGVIGLGTLVRRVGEENEGKVERSFKC